MQIQCCVKFSLLFVILDEVTVVAEQPATFQDKSSVSWNDWHWWLLI